MIGIIGAMQEEIVAIESEMQSIDTKELAGIPFHTGILKNKNVVVVKSGIGKVNMAMCTQLMIDNFDIEAIINVGVAGGADGHLSIGDIVISTQAFEHDMNVIGLGYQQGFIPDMPIDDFIADERLVNIAYDASLNLDDKIKVEKGIVATGDIFVAAKSMKEKIARMFGAKCIEMEGAAMAHVAVLNKVPFVIIRAISDDADENSLFNYRENLNKVVSNCCKIINNMLKAMD